MKREIKFRAKSVETDEWIEGYYVQLAGFDYIVPFNSAFRDILDADYEAAFEEVDAKTLSQFTGLKDNNGVNIFEGDILYYRYDDELEADGYGEVYNEVVFKDGAFGIMGEITNEFLSFSCNPIKTEVVAGNIHDYPELLK